MWLVKVVFACIGAILLGSPAIAKMEERVRFFDVEFELYAGDQLLGNPHFIMRDGGSAVITSPVKGAYALRATLARDDRDPLAHRVSNEIYRVEAGRWVKVGSPYLAGRADRSMSTILPSSNLRLVVRINSDFNGKISAKQSEFGKNRCTKARLDQWSNTMSQPVKISTQITDCDQVGGCCSAGCNQTCCSDGPMCCGDRLCSGSGCCNY